MREAHLLRLGPGKAGAAPVAARKSSFIFHLCYNLHMKTKSYGRSNYYNKDSDFVSVLNDELDDLALKMKQLGFTEDNINIVIDVIKNMNYHIIGL